MIKYHVIIRFMNQAERLVLIEADNQGFALINVLHALDIDDRDDVISVGISDLSK